MDAYSATIYSYIHRTSELILRHKLDLVRESRNGPSVAGRMWNQAYACLSHVCVEYEGDQVILASSSPPPSSLWQRIEDLFSCLREFSFDSNESKPIFVAYYPGPRPYLPFCRQPLFMSWRVTILKKGYPVYPGLGPVSNRLRSSEIRITSFVTFTRPGLVHPVNAVPGTTRQPVTPPSPQDRPISTPPSLLLLSPTMYDTGYDCDPIRIVQLLYLDDCLSYTVSLKT
jgi:hypothetical protein